MTICWSQKKKTENQRVSKACLENLFTDLFLVYFNDLAGYAQNNNTTAIIADDTCFLKSGKKTESSLLPGLDKITIWFSYNKLSPNTSKVRLL